MSLHRRTHRTKQIRHKYLHSNYEWLNLSPLAASLNINILPSKSFSVPVQLTAAEFLVTVSIFRGAAEGYE